MNVFNLFAVLTLQKEDYEKALNETENKSKGWAERVEGFMKSKAVVAWAAVGMAVVEVGKKINQLMQQSLQYADQMGDLAAKYGTTSEAISEMAYVATQAGSDVNTLTNAMSMLYMRAKQDGEAFQQLGVSVKDSQGNFKAMDELFWETVYAMNRLESDGEKSAYMLDLFGRSASNIGEILRKDSSELEEMRKRAHDLGIVVNQTTADFAGSWFDKLDELKLQGQSVLASLVAGAPDAEEKLQNFIDNVLEMLDSYIPAFVNFALRLLLQINFALLKNAPSLAIEIVNTIQDVILNMDWLQFGVDLGKAILEGLINLIISQFNKFFGWLGVNIPKVDFGVGEDIGTMSIGEISGEEYEISERVSQDITVKVEANGDSTVSQETAEKTAEALAPYIDKILGGK